MQISLTKKLATATGTKPGPADETLNPLFCWTAHWINTFENRSEDMLVMVNHATRFTVAIYGMKKTQLKTWDTRLLAAIRNTLLAMQLNPELVADYLQQAGELTFAANQDRKMTTALNHQGLDAALMVGDAVNASAGQLRYEDTLGAKVSKRIVGYSGKPDAGFVPAREMVRALVALTGKPAYQYRAFELLVTLDLGAYQATRRIIVPADISFRRLHEVLQKVFRWKNYHSYEFLVFGDRRDVAAQLVPDHENLAINNTALLMDGHTLSDYLPEHAHMQYIYDLGDDWTHGITLLRVIDLHDAESPCLLEAVGQAPPEDVGGVEGFLTFRDILQSPNHPRHFETKQWAGWWSPELDPWDAMPRVID